MNKNQKGIALISIILFIALAFAVSFYFVFGKTLKKSDRGSNQNTQNDSFEVTVPPAEVKDQIEAEGVIRTTGLSNNEKETLGLKFSNYQVVLTNKDKSEKSVWSYFLEKEDAFSKKYLGKCVRVEGSLVRGWENVSGEFELNGQYTYGNLALIPGTIEPIDESSCSPYLGTGSSADHFEKTEFTGILRYGIRPAPDIGYDYILELNTPYLDENSAMGEPVYLKQIDATPFSNEIWSAMEAKIGKRVTLEGYYVWGYAESKYLETHAVK